MDYQWIFVLRKWVLLFAAIYAISGALTITIKPYKLTCDFDKETVEYFNCSLRPVNRTRTVLNLKAYLKGSHDKILIKIKLFKKESVSYQPFLLDVVEDLCKYMKYGSGIYITMLLPSIMKASNVNHTCPYSGFVQIGDYMIDPKDIPLPLPSGNYKLKLSALPGHNARELGSASVFLIVGDDKFSG